MAASVPVKIVITLSQLNFGCLDWMATWALAHGVAEFRVQPLLKLGRGEAIADQRLTPEMVDLLILKVTDLANRHRGVMRCGIIGVARRFLEMHPCGAYVCNGLGCHRRVAQEIKKIVVREDGTVLPEVTNLSPTFALGTLGEVPLADMVLRYFNEGYHRFDHLCRTTYTEVLPTWPAAIVPWDQIIAERSWTLQPHEVHEDLNASCADSRVTATGCSSHAAACAVTAHDGV